MIFNASGPGVPQHRSFRAIPKGSPPYIAPITRDQVAAAAFIDDANDLDAQNSTYLDSCIETATLLAWKITGFEADQRSISVYWSGDGSPVSAAHSAWIDLAVYPVTSIDSVAVIDAQGVETAASTVAVDLNSTPPRVMLSSDGLSVSGVYSTIRFDLTVGSTDSAQRDPYAMAVGRLAAYLFMHRAQGDPSPISDSGTLPILRRYKVGGPL